MLNFNKSDLISGILWVYAATWVNWISSCRSFVTKFQMFPTLLSKSVINKQHIGRMECSFRPQNFSSPAPTPHWPSTRLMYGWVDAWFWFFSSYSLNRYDPLFFFLQQFGGTCSIYQKLFTKLQRVNKLFFQFEASKLGLFLLPPSDFYSHCRVFTRATRSLSPRYSPSYSLTYLFHTNSHFSSYCM